MVYSRLSVSVDAPRSAVWEALADVRSHVDWMADATEIHLTSEQATGVGAMFECKTRVGPLRTRDQMVVTEWQQGTLIGVNHVGIVTGSGRFVLADSSKGGTTVNWEEKLDFPWWVGGCLTSAIAGPILKLVWRGNLMRLARIVEDHVA